MSEENSFLGVFFILTIIASLGVGVFCGYRDGSDMEKKNAIQAGVAYYDCNPLSGETTFHYRKPETLDIMEFPPKQ